MNRLRSAFRWLQGPKGRLATRAAFVGGGIVWSSYTHTGTVPRAAMVAAALAAFEILSPANPLVGLFKKP